ncbi:S8 family serine peptidase [Streptomyces sp. NPDC059909]|uniref:S8 family serine peptidase n=1 Tax=Streptomyces sp. NPDC059909 TaxID=3346998 RepID=UPI00365E0729
MTVGNSVSVTALERTSFTHPEKEKLVARRSIRKRSLAALAAALTALPLALAAAPAHARPDDPVAPALLQQKAESKVVDGLHKHDKATFWINLTSEADTKAARAAGDKDTKARKLYAAKTAHAKKSQAALADLLREAGASFTSYWITNSIKVTGVDKALAEKIAARFDVASIEADDPITIPDPLPGQGEPGADSVEWNIDRINAPKVWAELGSRGEGVVVANIDTGVQYDHPALKAAYRGAKADGTFDHAYNWFDPAKVCSGTAPCDNNGHGTHTMGTMAGADGIGVAPGAKWIAAKGCESSSCSRGSLLAAGQWVVAPTDPAGGNPRPDLAPDVVNNSWGANVYDPWYRTVVQSWRDGGIFPAFSNGNAGPACNTSGSPGSYTNSYSSGAFDINNAIASFSSRGTGEDGGIKPDLAAPGVNVRSSWAGGGYNVISGTSMASPHTAATVALMWAASPAIQGDIAATEALLDKSAVDTPASQCGGTDAKNNVFGEGRLDAFAAVSATPRGPLGAASGTVTGPSGPVSDAVVSFDGPMKATVTTGADGGYGLPKLMVGDYKLTVAKFGFISAEATVTVIEGATATKDFTLAAAPSRTLSGIVRSSAGPEAGATVVAQGTPVNATTAADGTYSVTLPLGTYDLVVTPAGACASGTSVRVTVSAEDTNLPDITLADRTDTFGYSCRVGGGDFPTGDTKLTYTSTTSGSATFNLPFAVPLYGKGYSKATATTEGVLAFGTSSTNSSNATLPTTSLPNGALYPLWDNMTIDAAAGVYWSATGTAPHRKVVVEWRNALVVTGGERVTFSAVIGEDGAVSYHYETVPGGGASATVGLENATGTDALLYSFNTASVTDGSSVSFRTAGRGVVAGRVVDANDKEPLAGAAVKVGAETATTAADGTYAVQPEAGSYPLEISSARYETVTGTTDVEGGGIAYTETALKTPLVTPATVVYREVIPAGQTRERTLELTNTGTDSAYTVSEKADVAWIKPLPVEGTIATGRTVQVPLTFDTTGATPGTVLTATLVLNSASGRAPVVEIPVSVVVPAYQTALDTGAGTTSVDVLGDTWGPDRPYTAGSYGYLGSTTDVSTSKPIIGATDPTLYRTARQDMYEYRFDGLPSGTYRIELGFAELGSKGATDRVFDVMAEGTQYVANLDLALEAGRKTALDRAFNVTVTDGRLNLRFVANAGKPLVNSIRVTERSDLG